MQKKSFPSRKNDKRINGAIVARELLVISDAGESLGTMSREEALNLAAEQDLDLVEVGLKDGITMAKIVDY